ncbi:MAG: tetratricopeptide repeat protein [Candidatus Promineifilaceae bacterium]|nr:tetratricopeptide repeat protein [Candidatus Promineifilaceae bacterium]
MSDPRNINQLEEQLAELNNDSIRGDFRRIDALNDLAWALADVDTKRAQELAEEAFELAGATDDGIPIYELGKAYSLRSLGYLNMRSGNYVSGLEQSFEARKTFETLKQGDGLCDVLDHIGSIFLYIGEFPDALEYYYMQLDCAQRLQDQRRIANAYNNLAANHYMTGNHERAKEIFHNNLQLAREIDSTRHICITELNLAEVYLSIGEPDQALGHALRGLRLSRQAGFESFEVYGLEFLGKAYLAQDSSQKALSTMNEALRFSREKKSQKMEMQTLKNLGMVYRDMGQLENALSHAGEALKIAQSIGAHHELAECAFLLAELHEQQGDFEQAFRYIEQYHEINGRLLGEKATQRLQVLQVAHDTEVAKKEAETLQIKTIQLEREVSERKKAEKALEDARDNLEERINARTAELRDTVLILQKEIQQRERAEAEVQQLVEMLEQRVADRSRELAALYDMTILLSDVESLADTLQPALKKIMLNAGANAISVHIMSANQRTMQLAAQLGLSDSEHIDEVHISDDFVEWLNQADAPLMFVADADFQPIMPKAFFLSRHSTFFGTPLRVQGQIIGLLSLYREQEKTFDFEHVSLLITMAEQLGVIIQNHRLQEQSLDMTRVLERQRLARELHDSVAQRIYSLHLFARSGLDAANDGDLEQAHVRLQQVETNTLLALREMRLLLYQLRPLALEGKSLVGAFEERFDQVERRLGIEAVVMAGSIPELDKLDEEQLYYIITEALNNALQHAQATRVELLFTIENGELEVLVRDNGQGFDPKVQAPGMGLENICSRTENLGGKVVLESTVGEGTVMQISKKLAA